MADPSSSTGGATSAQLRDDIDSGRTKDKVPLIDLAAAPLGTDDEAAGTPPTNATAAQARAEEIKRSFQPSPQGDAPSGTSRVMIWSVFAVLVALAALAIIVLGRG